LEDDDSSSCYGDDFDDFDDPTWEDDDVIWDLVGDD
jgi:hypothetical protein